MTAVMRVAISLASATVDIEIDGPYASDPLDDMCARAVAMAVTVSELGLAPVVDDPDVLPT